MHRKMRISISDGASGCAQQIEIKGLNAYRPRVYLARGVHPFQMDMRELNGQSGRTARREQALILSLALLASLLLVAPSTRAQYPDQQTQGDIQTGPQAAGQTQSQAQATGVARVSLVEGAVSTQRGDTGDWNAATVNTPIVPGDRISTGDRSRAEVQLDYGNIIRLDGNAVIRVTQLDEQHIQIEIAQGLVSYTSLPSSSADVELDTPNLAVHPQRDGVYRVQVNTDGETLVTVRRGQAEAGTAEGSTTIHAGEQITVRGEANDAQYRTSAAPVRDSFDQWSEDRDRLLQNAQNSEPLNPYYTGGADLNNSGTWQNVPDYGAVWSPNNVPQDWAPYRNGSWVWEPYWGWTWVSYEPWGWAPYHYGRWFLWNSSWVWWPGPVYRYYRPLWAPAYVSFFGFGSGVGFGSYGWIPLGPADGCYPWWGGFGVSFSFYHYGDYNHYHGRGGYIAPLAGPLHGRVPYSNVNGLESNARLRAGITSVPSSRFGNGRVVPERRTFTGAEIRNARFAHGGLPVVPGRNSLSATDRPARPGSVPGRNLDAQRFMMHNRPTQTRPSFASESARIQEQVRRQGSSLGNSPSREAPRGNLRTAEPTGSSFIRQESGAAGRTQQYPSGANNQFRSFAGSRSAYGGATNAFAAPEGERSSVQSHPSPAQQPRGNASENGGWRHFSAQTGQPGFTGSRGSPYSSQSFRPTQRNQGRPPLELHKSIVQERAPAYSTPRGSPSYVPPRSFGSETRQQQPAYRAPEPPRGYSQAPRSAEPNGPRGEYGGGGHRGGGNSGGSRGGGSHGGGSHGGGSHPSGGHHSGRP